MNWRKFAAKTGVYQFSVFIRRLLGPKLTERQFRRLELGGYVYKWMAEILIRYKTIK